MSKTIQMEVPTYRNNNIDILKCFCALAVVFIHCSYPYKSQIIPVTDVAVPLFFCISGYFVYENARNLRRIKRIGFIIMWSLLLYFLKTIIWHIIILHQFYVPSIEDIVNFLLFNDVVFAIHLWYLPAYFYVLLIAWLIDKYNLWKIAFVCIVPLILLGVVVKISIADICPANIFYYRNFLFTGLPFFLTGSCVAASRLNYLSTFHNNKISVSLKSLAFVLILFLVVIRYYIENDYLYNINLLLLVFIVFLFILLLPTSKETFFSLLGEKYSLYIYVFHLAVMSIVELSATHLPSPIYEWYMYVNPLCVFILTVLIVYLFKKLKILHL